MLTVEKILEVRDRFLNQTYDGTETIMQINNPYFYLRTLLDDDGKHDELNARIYCVAARKEPLENWADFVGYTPDYTTSLDALIPLLPKGYEWRVDSDGYCEVTNRHGEPFYVANGKTPALAMLDCLLRVLEFKYDEEKTK